MRPAAQSGVAGLRRRVAELERENARLGEFAAMAAHEMLKPLLLIENCGRYVTERTGHGIDLDSRHDLHTIVEVTSRMRLVVEALLADSLGHGAATRQQSVDLKAVVDECLVVLAPEIESSAVNVEVGPLPVVRGNRALLGGVFGNLLANAIVHAPARGSQVKVEAVRAESGWVFAVATPGPPIAEEERRSIFEPRKRGSAARGLPGTGLGLAIVRQIVESHGGQVSVMSTKDAINRFFFTLPA
jgi:light-regulated signal transduction histidine kinase (bacteriophytochrome)